MGAISKVKQRTNEVKPKPSETNKSKQKASNYEETWSCVKCTLINSTKNQVCILCGASYLNTKEPLKEDIETDAKEKTPTNFDEPKEHKVDFC